LRLAIRRLFTVSKNASKGAVRVLSRVTTCGRSCLP
jgi:hypothetical protein